MKVSFHRPISRILIAGTLCLVFLLGTVLGWLNTNFLSEDGRFRAFSDQLFTTEVSGSMLTLHYSLAYPEKKKISRPAPSLGTVSLPDSATSAASEKSLTRTLQKLQSFNISKLAESNQITLDMLLLYYQTQSMIKGCEFLEEPLSPSLGIQAQLPVLLAEYTFYQKQDIADYLNLLVSVKSYFESLLAFEQEKSKQGYFMSDTTLDRVLEQCQDFIKNPDNNYMQEIFCEKLKNFGKLPQQEQDRLIQRHKEILSNKVIPAYRDLIQGLQELRGTGRPSQGLAHLSNGKQYYEYLLKSQTGSYTSIKSMQKRLAGQITADMQNVQNILKKQPALLRSLNSTPELSESEPQVILSGLREKMLQDFPALGETDFSVRNVHSSMQKYLSPAFYLTPPLDTRSPNTIYINPASQRNDLELFTTLSHEGFPGHLYQTVFFGNTGPSDIRYLLTCSGYIEGWATYVESYGYQYAASYLNDDTASDYVQLAWLNRSISLCLYSLLDIGIHYYGWNQAESSRLLKLFGITDEHAVSEIYQYIVETPGNYQKYCWGYINFLDLKSEWQKALGNDFNLKDFHQNLLEIGPVQFPVLKKYMKKRLGTKLEREVMALRPLSPSPVIIHFHNCQKISAISKVPS